MAKKRVAVFDVDGTIFRSSLLIQLVEQLIEDGIFPEKMRQEYQREQLKWLEREGDYPAYIDAMVRAFRRHLKGVHYADFADAGEHMVERHWKHTYRYTRDLIENLKERGYYLLAISHSPKTVMDQFCPRLGFDKAYGTLYEIGPQDRFTGRMLEEHIIFNKAATLRRAIEREDLSLTHSFGVGDTESDIPFLEMVANPICFNPNQKLYKYGRRLGWKTIVERKDVIHQI